MAQGSQHVTTGQLWRMLYTLLVIILAIVLVSVLLNFVRSRGTRV
ncbi:MAG: hypothetical protein JWM05_1106 [Acidimicrobiales bacterium]|nr:hypothetical protein [Acidimicrobiales bacterium]